MSTRLFNQKAVVAGLIFTSGAVITAGCGAHTSAAPPSAPAVDVATVEQRDVPQYREWVGTLDGMVNAAIKAQVNGYLLSQNYAEGSFVKQGQLLFQIDARPFQAALDQAQGQLAQANAQASQARAQLLLSQAQLGTAEANQHKAQLDEDRYAPLAKQQAVTQQDLDNATQTNVAAKAQVEAAKAQVEASRAQTEAATAAIQAATANVQAAKVNLEFTRLTSPISGVAGMAQMQVGSLVGPSGGPVTTVSTLDPIKVNFTVGEQEYLAFSRAAMDRMQLELILIRWHGLPTQRQILVCGPAGKSGNGRDPIDRFIPKSGQRAASRPIWASARRHRHHGWSSAGAAKIRNRDAGHVSSGRGRSE